MSNPPGQEGVITTQNSVPTGVATSRSAVEISTDGFTTVGVQTKGTYTGALSGQVTSDGSTWVTLAATDTFTRQTTGVASATITSAEQDVYVVSVSGAKAFRVTGLAAMTGTVAVSLQAL
jgi:hypothetical protein